MNKKTLIIVGLCALGLCFGEAQAVNKPPTPIIINKWEIADPPQGYEVINLLGGFGYRYNDCPTTLELNYPDRGSLPQGTTSNEELAKAMGFSVAVAPNPANNWVSVDYTLPVGEDRAHMKILNAQGSTVAHYDLQGNTALKTLDLRGFTPGVYVYSVSCGKYLHTGKLVIVK